jgi:hypothetical protein
MVTCGSTPTTPRDLPSLIHPGGEHPDLVAGKGDLIELRLRLRARVEQVLRVQRVEPDGGQVVFVNPGSERADDRRLETGFLVELSSCGVRREFR